jgi:hypothetical protein
MASQGQEKRCKRVYRPVFGVDYSVVVEGVRHIVRLEAKQSKDDWTVRDVAADQFYHINPKTLETAQPE